MQPQCSLTGLFSLRRTPLITKRNGDRRKVAVWSSHTRTRTSKTDVILGTQVITTMLDRRMNRSSFAICISGVAGNGAELGCLRASQTKLC